MDKIYLLFLLLIVLVSGCKLKIIVPAGGNIVSASGARDCAEGDSCSFDVSDIFFEDSFGGEPAEGYAFTGWKRGKDTICGGSGKDCALSTAGFAGNEPLMAILESDRVFHLRPMFSKKSGSGNIVNRPLNVCLNKSMYENGFRSDITLRLYDDGRKEGTKRTVSNVSGPASFKGESVMKLHEVITSRGVLNSKLELTSYSVVDLPAQRVRVRGLDQSFITPVAQEAEGIFSPAFLQRFDLKVGDSYTTAYTLNLTFPDGSSADITRNISTEFIYDGVETITIPVGTFQACRIHRFDNVNGQLSESYNWIGQGNGVLLLESDANFVPEAAVVSGIVNGKLL